MFCLLRAVRKILNVAPSSIRLCAAGVSSEVKFFCAQQELVSSVMRDIRKFENIFRKYRDSNLFKDCVSKCFLRNQCLPSYVLDILRIASDNTDCSPEFIMSYLDTLYLNIHENNIEFYPSVEEKKEALQMLLIYQNYRIIKLICDVFRMSEHLSDFKKFIDELISCSKLVEASFCISALSLHQEYPIERVLLPLLFDGKIHAALTFLSKHQNMQIEVAKLLDSFLMTNYSDTPNLAINSRKVFKGLNSIVNNFEISTEHCKNLHYIRSRGAINLLIKRKSQQLISENTWEEMVSSLVGNNTKLKEHLLYKLTKNNDVETALKMMKKLNIESFDFSSVSVRSESESNLENLGVATNNEDIVEYLTFDQSSSDIKFVDSEEKFLDCISDIQKNGRIVGIDSEWKPHFGLAPERLSLVQLAIQDKVYILDLLALLECLTAEHWDSFMDGIFQNERLIKLGCGIISDVQMLAEHIKGTKGKRLKFSHLLDMVILYEKLMEIYPDEMTEDFETVHNAKSLSKLCEIILGKPLNKEERLCDWEKRPLTEPQLEYAALDAHCLVQMFQKLKDMASIKKMNFQHLVKISIHSTNRAWSSKKKFKTSANLQHLEVQKAISIDQFKVVMDSSLEIYARQLRHLGADVLTESNLTAESAVKISKSEERVIVCSKSMFNKVQTVAPDALCFKVDGISNLPLLLMKFNVQLNG